MWIFLTEKHRRGAHSATFSLHCLAWPRSPTGHRSSDPVQRTSERAHTERRNWSTNCCSLQVYTECLFEVWSHLLGILMSRLLQSNKKRNVNWVTSWCYLFWYLMLRPRDDVHHTCTLTAKLLLCVCLIQCWSGEDRSECTQRSWRTSRRWTLN